MTSGKMEKKQENEWVDVYDDALMVKLGMRCPNIEDRDPEVWTKTKKEKDLLRKLRRHKHNFGPSVKEPKCIGLESKLIIQIKKHPKFRVADTKYSLVHYKTTFSVVCKQYDIPRILNMYRIFDKYGVMVNDLIVKYTWNGKTYGSNDLPYKGW